MISHELIGQRLLALGRITEQELDQALSVQHLQGGRLGAILVRLGAISDEVLLPVLSDQLRMPILSGDFPTGQQLLKASELWEIDESWMRANRVLVWALADDQACAAAEDPLDTLVHAAISERIRNRHVQWHLVRPQDLERALEEIHVDESFGSTSMDASRLRELAEDAPVIAFVNNLFADAIDRRASDIHLEPGDRLFDVRLRVDGVLHTKDRLPVVNYAAISSRIKLIAGLDIAERRLPQDGRVSIRASGADVDIRVSVIPAVHGEAVVMRLLPKQRADLRLEDLGLDVDHLQQLRSWLAQPNGLILVTGPTGSGKSTTLYASLAATNDLSRKIVTVEDPVEYRLSQVVQIQVQADIGYTFARALRSILRHDPDIILVGEIRDRETAEIAIQAALTGHLVLASLHTNDALSAVTRLTDMGIDAYLVAASLRAVMAQRLVRRVCSACSAPAAYSELRDVTYQRFQAKSNQVPPQVAQKSSSPSGTASPQWLAGSGCSRCLGTGYAGRLAVHEMVNIDAEMAHAIASSQSFAQIVHLADQRGRRSLAEDALVKAADGITTWEEVCRVVGDPAAA